MLPARGLLLNFRTRGACARSAEAAGLSWDKRMPGDVVEMPKKRRHRPPGERNGLAEMAFSSLLQWTCFKGGQTGPRPTNCRFAVFMGRLARNHDNAGLVLCGLVGFQDCFRSF